MSEANKSFTNDLPLDTFNSAHFSFLNCAGCYSDKDLLAKLGVPAIRHLSSWHGSDEIEGGSLSVDLGHAAYITDDGKWAHVIDNMYFDMFHHRALKRNLKKFSKEFEVYHCWAGDTDDSFEITHWQGGRKVRHLAGDIRQMSFGKDIGIPFECEALFTTKESRKLDWQARSLMLSVARELGININHRQAKFRAYEIEAGWKG